MYRYPFAVGEVPYCVWEFDLPERNDRFLEHLDSGYFAYVADLHARQLNGENHGRAAVALRAAYHHALEALFSLLGGLVQAPGCVAGWIPKCSNEVLRRLVEAISHGQPVFTQRGRQVVSWNGLSRSVHSQVWPDEQPAGATADRFGLAWERFAGELLDPIQTDEYNSLKHGFRVSSGGFVLRIGTEPSYGVAPAEEEMETVGASPFGTSFYAPEPIAGVTINTKHHFRVRHHSMNWSAEAMVQRLQILSYSINNTIGLLRILGGSPPNTVRFIRPADPSYFDAAWGWNVGVTHSNLDVLIAEESVHAASKEDLLHELTATGPQKQNDGSDGSR